MMIDFQNLHAHKYCQRQWVLFNLTDYHIPYYVWTIHKFTMLMNVHI